MQLQKKVGLKFEKTSKNCFVTFREKSIYNNHNLVNYGIGTESQNKLMIIHAIYYLPNLLHWIQQDLVAWVNVKFYELF